MEFNNLQAEFYSLMNDKDETIFTIDECKDWLNTANLLVAGELKQLWSTATLSTDGTALVNLTTGLSNFYKMLHVHYNGNEIFFITPEELSMKNYRWISQTGTPTRWTLQGHYLRLYPYTSALASGLNLHYLYKPTIMTNVNDLPLDGIVRLEPFHPLVYLRAGLKACAKINDKEKVVLIKDQIADIMTEHGHIIHKPDEGHQAEESQEGVDYY